MAVQSAKQGHIMKLSDEFLEAARKLAEGEVDYCDMSVSGMDYQSAFINLDVFKAFWGLFPDFDVAFNDRKFRVLACLFAHHFYRDIENEKT
jgi:hypothetical protein